MTAAVTAGLWRWLRAYSGSLAVGIALATVTGVAGFISYTHICALMLDLHQSWKTAHLTPFAVDGQLVIGGVVIATIAGRPRWWGLAGILPGLGESLFANWESGIVHGYVAAAAAMVAAQAFAVSSFLFELWLRKRKTARGQGRPTSPEELFRLFVASGSRRVVAAVAGVEPSQVQRWERMLAAADAETPLSLEGMTANA